MQEQNLHLGFEWVAEGLGLARGSFERNSQIAGQPGTAAISGAQIGCGKREHVSRLVLAAVVAIQLPDLRVAGEQHGNRAAEADRLDGLRQEAAQFTLAHHVAAGSTPRLWRFDYDHLPAALPV
jgi:hypothetical protein